LRDGGDIRLLPCVETPGSCSAWGRFHHGINLTPPFLLVSLPPSVRAYDPEEYAYMLPSLPVDVREVLAFVTR